MSAVDPGHVRQRYNAIAAIWPETDLWHRETRKGLEWGLRRFRRAGLIPMSGRMLDAGSGGESYFTGVGDRYQVDVAERLLRGHSNSVCASVEHLPFADESFDCALCVGSVLNYVNILDAVLEMARVLKPSGTLIIDVETSNSAEYWRTEHWGRHTTFVTTEYQGESEAIWLYSLANIYATLEATGLRILDKVGIHILSVLTYRLLGKRSAYLRCLDGPMNWLPGLRELSTNVLICCQKVR